MALLDPYTGPWTSAEAAHLARRTTFGATPVGLAGLVSAGMSGAVDSIIDYLPVDQPLEDSITNLPSNVENNKIKTPINAQDLEGWWLYRMAHSTQPLQQQFALFLHDHFVSEYGKIQANVSNASNDGNDGSQAGQSCLNSGNPLAPDAERERKIIVRLFRDQHSLFLTQGHLNFRTTLIRITRDPCMLIYLDNRLNVKSKPQENYGREVMELFSMGVGNYTEDDVRNAAKAFTGETVRTACADNWPYDYFYNTAQHNTTSKVLFGTNFNETTIGADTVRVVDLILAYVSESGISPAHSVYPATSLYMSWKFITWFVGESITIDHPAVPELASFFLTNTSGGSTYNVRETLRKLLKSQFFYDLSHRFKMYKHPADYMITALRNLNVQETSYSGTAAYRLRDMGMRLFEPPTVEGWHHGRSWVNSSSLIARFNYADRLSGTTVLPNSALDLLIQNGTIANVNDNQGIMDYFSSRLLLDSFTVEETAVFNKLFSDIQGTSIGSTSIFYRKFRAALHLTMTMPRYQLK